jgi:hypothetical protein
LSYNYSQPYFSWAANGLNTIHPVGGGAIGGWVELGRTTLGSAGDAIDVSSISNKRYYMLLSDHRASGAITPILRVGNSTLDSGSNYAHRNSTNGGADGTTTSAAEIDYQLGGATTNDFGVTYVANYSSKEKLFINHMVYQSTAGAATAPPRREIVGKWTNTSNAIDIIGDQNTGAGDFNTGSELVVLGWDPADTHTNNFWEELASDELSGSGTMDTGTFTAKKYLMVQFYAAGKSSAFDVSTRFNSDSGSNYANRYQSNGASDSTATSTTSLQNAESWGGDTPSFVTWFIINNTSNEKLVYGNAVTQNTAGAANAPNRREFAGKWANTSNQITKITITDKLGSGTFSSGSIIKVWGAD